MIRPAKQADKKPIISARLKNAVTILCASASIFIAKTSTA